MKVIFLDESGDHNLEIIDQQYPVFVLAGAVFDYEYYIKKVKGKIKKFKKDLFQNDKIILHTADIYRNKNGFEKMKDEKFRNKFYHKLNKLIHEIDFKIIACAIKKEKHFKKYGINALDPYLLSLEFVVERFIFSLDSCKERGVIVAESRNRQLDNQLELAWMNLKIKGTKYIEPSRITDKIKDFKIISKSKRIGGLEIADLVASPIGRNIIGKKNKEDFNIIKSKFRRNNQGHILGHGLVIFPKEK
jgi:hypothetical protein